MFKRSIAVFAVITLGTALAAQAQDTAAGLWRDPGAIEQLDFAGGPGGPQGQPTPPFHFVRENLLGSTAKIQVVDSNGIGWMVKFGEEVQPQTFAARLAWALGYYALPVYAIRSGAIEGASGLTRAAKYIKPDGRFSNGSFQLYIDSSIRWLGDQQSWTWETNPFAGTHQLNGLKVLVMLLSDWDNKDARDIKFGSNIVILVYPDEVVRYLVTDWGGSMGTWGGLLSRSKWNCVGFEAQTANFVKRVQGGALQWGFSGQHTDDFTASIDVDDVQWLLTYLGRISDAQLTDGLLASGATPAEAHCFARALRQRIEMLRTLG